MSIQHKTYKTDYIEIHKTLTETANQPITYQDLMHFEMWTC